MRSRQAEGVKYLRTELWHNILAGNPTWALTDNFGLWSSQKCSAVWTCARRRLAPQTHTAPPTGLLMDLCYKSSSQDNGNLNSKVHVLAFKALPRGACSIVTEVPPELAPFAEWKRALKVSKRTFELTFPKGQEWTSMLRNGMNVSCPLHYLCELAHCSMRMEFTVLLLNTKFHLVWHPGICFSRRLRSLSNFVLVQTKEKNGFLLSSGLVRVQTVFYKNHKH